MNARFSRGVSPIAVTAALSVAILISAGGMQLGKAFAKPLPVEQQDLIPAKPPSYLAIEDYDENGVPDWQDELMRSGVVVPTTSPATTTPTSNDPLAGIGEAFMRSLISGYLSLSQNNAYTPERGEQLANTIADSFRAPETYEPHTLDELSFDSSTSKERIARYRTDMQTAFLPMITDEEHELTLFAAFIESGDDSWLDRLNKAAENYHAVETNLIALEIPKDAAPEHLRVTNAIGSFAETLERMVHFGKDPLATMALLQTYNEAEREFDLAFDALVKYYARTIGNN